MADSELDHARQTLKDAQTAFDAAKKADNAARPSSTACNCNAATLPHFHTDEGIENAF